MSEIQKFAQLLSQLVHFSKISFEDCLEIIEAGEILKFNKDQPVFLEGEACSGFYVLLRGQIHLQKYGPDMQHSIVATFDAPSSFNEVPILDGGPNPVTVIASQDSIFWRIDPKGFLSLQRTYPSFSHSLMISMAKRTRKLLSEYEDLSFRSVRARAAKLILDLSSNGNIDIDRSDYGIGALSARISTAPEAFSRAISFFKNNGYLEASRSRIIVNQPKALSRLAKLNNQN